MCDNLDWLFISSLFLANTMSTVSILNKCYVIIIIKCFLKAQAVFIFSFYFEIILYFPKAIYRSHQEEQLKKCSQSCQHDGENDLNSEFLLQVFKWHSTYGCLIPVTESFSHPVFLTEVVTEYALSTSLSSTIYPKLRSHNMVACRSAPFTAASCPSVAVLLGYPISSLYPGKPELQHV